jgi:hypothetical protein
MFTQQRSARIKNAARPSILLDKPSTASDRSRRVIQVVLALYLLPALLVVLAIGGLGMLIIGFAQLLTGPVRASRG